MSNMLRCRKTQVLNKPPFSMVLSVSVLATETDQEGTHTMASNSL